MSTNKPSLWTPSEGLLRADAIVEKIENAAAVCGMAVHGQEYHAWRHRAVQIVAEAIDKALVDGSDGSDWGHPSVPSAAPAATADAVGVDPDSEWVKEITIPETVTTLHEDDVRAQMPKPKPKGKKRKTSKKKSAAPAAVDSSAGGIDSGEKSAG